MSPDPEQESIDNRFAALSRWAKEPDRAAALTPAKEAAAAALTTRLEREVDPDGVLDPAKRDRLVESQRKLHFADLARKSHRARRARELAERLEAEVRNALVSASGRA